MSVKFGIRFLPYGCIAAIADDLPARPSGANALLWITYDWLRTPIRCCTDEDPCELLSLIVIASRELGWFAAILMLLRLAEFLPEVFNTVVPTEFRD